MAIIMYHDDIDGHASGYWAYTHLLKFYALDTIKAIPVDYHLPLPLDKVLSREEVWIVDFSLSPEKMRELLKKTPNIVWIDHHKTAIEKYNDSDIDVNSIDGVRRVGDAGCLLTYQYTTKNYKYIPLFVRHIDDYDVWKWKMEHTDNFIMGLMIEDTNPTSVLWKDLLSDEIQGENLYRKILKQGIVINKYKEKTSKYVINTTAFDMIWNGYKCLVINNAKITALWQVLVTTDKWNKGNYDIFMGFSYVNGGKWRVELRSPDDGVDVGELAKANGGGGHIHASGFITKDLIC